MSKKNFFEKNQAALKIDAEKASFLDSLVEACKASYKESFLCTQGTPLWEFLETSDRTSAVEKLNWLKSRFDRVPVKRVLFLVLDQELTLSKALHLRKGEANVIAFAQGDTYDMCCLWYENTFLMKVGSWGDLVEKGYKER